MANVILLDDDPLVRQLLTTLLKKGGHNAWSASTAAEALALLRGSDHFDLVILDLVLPGMSGIDLARRIQADYPKTAMIALSGYLREDSMETVETLRGIGVTDILQKPVDPLHFERAVQEALGHHR